VISLEKRRVRKYAEEQVGTKFLRWRLLRICGLHWVFVAMQAAGAQIRKLYLNKLGYLLNKYPLK
jgi:hypothetical protein